MIRQVPCNPHEVIADVNAAIEIKAEEKNLEYQFRYLNPLPDKVYIDPNRVRQTLINLISDTIDYTQTGSVELAINFVDDSANRWQNVLQTIRQRHILEEWFASLRGSHHLVAIQSRFQ